MSTGRRKVEMTRRRMNEMYGACAALERNNEPFSQRFSYAVAYNQDAIEGSVKAFEVSAKQDDEYNVYDKARIELAEEHSHKDKEGEPIMNNGLYAIKKQRVFDKKLEELQRQHPAYEARQEFRGETVEVELHIVKMRHVPAYLGVAYMKMFKCFIEYEEEEFECPACEVELRMEESKLVEVYESEPEPEPESAPNPKKAKKRRKKK